MSYCRYCGTEIAYKRTKNEKWVPCNLLTGEPHFCKKDDKQPESGIRPCKICGKGVFASKKSGKTILFDYATLAPHVCKKADITRYKKYLEKAKQQAATARKPK